MIHSKSFLAGNIHLSVTAFCKAAWSYWTFCAFRVLISNQYRLEQYQIITILYNLMYINVYLYHNTLSTVNIYLCCCSASIVDQMQNIHLLKSKINIFFIFKAFGPDDTVDLSDYSADEIIVTLTSKIRKTRPYYVEVEISACVEGKTMCNNYFIHNLLQWQNSFESNH
jgi:hypothetical protein